MIESFWYYHTPVYAYHRKLFWLWVRVSADFYVFSGRIRESGTGPGGRDHMDIIMWTLFLFIFYRLNLSLYE
jgi:hypothetical protein